jgi:hypothetical protein
MVNDDVISMPDKWEYPWYAAWDLAFHCIALDAVDPDFAKEQLLMMLRAVYLHPNGQIPAYEWNFGDVNPPVHAFAALYTYNIDRQARGQGISRSWPACFRSCRSTSPGGRTARTRTVATLRGRLPRPRQHRRLRSQLAAADRRLHGAADGTAWMALFSLNMLEMALELAARIVRTKTSRSNSPSTSCGLPARWIGRATTTTSSGTKRTVLLRPFASARRLGHALKTRSMVGLCRFAPRR